MHIDLCSLQTPLRKIDVMVGLACAKQPRVSAALESDLTAGIVQMCAVDVRPVSVIEGEGVYTADR
jgi:hypothetical protein